MINSTAPTSRWLDFFLQVATLAEEGKISFHYELSEDGDAFQLFVRRTEGLEGFVPISGLISPVNMPVEIVAQAMITKLSDYGHCDVLDYANYQAMQFFFMGAPTGFDWLVPFPEPEPDDSANDSDYWPGT